MTVKQLDIFYPASMGDGWVLVEFRLYFLYSVDSPAPVSKKITLRHFWRERIFRIIITLMNSSQWFQVPQGKNTSDGMNYFSFVCTGKRGDKYTDYASKKNSSGNASTGNRLPNTTDRTLSAFERVNEYGWPGLRRREQDQNNSPNGSRMG